MADKKNTNSEFVPFEEALRIVLENVPVLSAVDVDVAASAGFVAAEDVLAKVNNPSVDVSLMDGFAVSSSAAVGTDPDNLLRLRIAGEVAAGGQGGAVREGECFRIFTGAPIPDGADAVIPVEGCEETNGEIVVSSGIAPGQNVQHAGENFVEGEAVLMKGAMIGAGATGILAAAGLAKIPVFRRPRVAVIAIGDELAAPGTPLPPGRIYASNLTVLSAWLARFGIECTTKIVTDEEELISGALLSALEAADAVVTTGGAWGSKRDFVKGVLEKLGWKKLFGRVRMRPGKGTAFGLLNEKPAFCLPGGPTSCEIAFLELALPGLLRMAGRTGSPFPAVKAVLAGGIEDKRPGWHRFIYGIYRHESEAGFSVKPLMKSRMKSMADANCIIEIAGDALDLRINQEVPVQIIVPDV